MGKEAAQESKIDRSDARKRSLDHLQRIYTLLLGLAVPVAASKLIGFPTGDGSLTEAGMASMVRPWVLPMFITLLVTLAPYYHGANRYLDDTYVFGFPKGVDSSFHSLLLDALFFAIEALIFYAMAWTVESPIWFFQLYVSLLVADVLWVWSLRRRNPRGLPMIEWWARLNAVFGVAVLVQLLPFLVPKDIVIFVWPTGIGAAGFAFLLFLAAAAWEMRKRGLMETFLKQMPRLELGLLVLAATVACPPLTLSDPLKWWTVAGFAIVRTALDYHFHTETYWPSNTLETSEETTS